MRIKANSLCQTPNLVQARSQPQMATRVEHRLHHEDVSYASDLGAGSRHSCCDAHAKIKLSYCSTIHLPIKVQGKSGSYSYIGCRWYPYSGIYCV